MLSPFVGYGAFRNSANWVGGAEYGLGAEGMLINGVFVDSVVGCEPVDGVLVNTGELLIGVPPLLGVPPDTGGLTTGVFKIQFAYKVMSLFTPGEYGNVTTELGTPS